MFRNYLITALRNLGRHRLHSAITLTSLVVGFAAALFVAVLWRSETTYDRFWPNADRIYLALQWQIEKLGAPIVSDAADGHVAAAIREEVPQAQAVARMAYARSAVRRGDVAGEEALRWADPGLFEVLKPTVLAGDLTTALVSPDSLVVTRSLARKYFGQDAPLGGVLLVTPTGAATEPVSLRVTAVIEDHPPHSHFRTAGYMSGLAAASPFNDPAKPAYTYFLARPGASRASLEKAADEVGQRRLRPAPTGQPRQLKLLPITEVYLKPWAYAAVGGDQMTINDIEKQGQFETLIMMSVIAGLVFTVAGINFITLMTARGAGRAVEVGVRKAAGARRGDLVVQFIGEALVLSLLAVLLAFAVFELGLPFFNTLLADPLRFGILQDPVLTGGFLAAALGIGALAGLYPALALSAYRPATVLKGGRAKTPGSAVLRQLLIALQFIPLVALALGVMIVGVGLQKGIAASKRMLEGDPLLVPVPCASALRTQIAAMPGVVEVACIRESWDMFNFYMALEIGEEVAAQARTPRGEVVRTIANPATPEAVRFHRLRPVAGRLLTPAELGGDQVMLNEEGARELGFSSAAVAVGQSLEWRLDDHSPYRTSTIAGVFANRGGLASFERGLLYQVPVAADASGLGVRLAGGNREEILAAIDRAWLDSGARGPLNAHFYRETIERRNQDQWQAIQVLAAPALLGALVAFLGLYGLSVFLAEQRTKEIGVRKALGASRFDVLKMLVLQFLRPVLIANLVACPLVFIAVTLLQRGMSPDDRFGTGVEVFAPVVIGSLVLAFVATFAHAWRVTGARPVTALRYE